MKTTLTVKSAKAAKAYGILACLKAYRMNCEGYGAAGVADEGPSILRTTRQADAAINAGREYTIFHTGNEGVGFADLALRIARSNGATN